MFQIPKWKQTICLDEFGETSCFRIPPKPMLEASISTILKALIVGIPRQGKVLTRDLICLTREV